MKLDGPQIATIFAALCTYRDDVVNRGGSHEFAAIYNSYKHFRPIHEKKMRALIRQVGASLTKAEKTANDLRMLKESKRRNR